MEGIDTGPRHLESQARSTRAHLHRRLGTSCKPAGTEVLTLAAAHNKQHPTAIHGG